jgi:hypothetical protein
MDGDFLKWAIQQTPAIVVCCWVIYKMFGMVTAQESARATRDARIADELKSVAETLSALSATVGLLFGRIKGGGS